MSNGGGEVEEDSNIASHGLTATHQDQNRSSEWILLKGTRPHIKHLQHMDTEKPLRAPISITEPL